MLRYIIKHATLVTAASNALVKYAKAVGANNAICVPNGISDSFLTLHDGTVLRDKLGISQQDMVVGYLGSLEFWLDMKNLIKGLSLAHKRGLPIKLVLIGKSLHTDYSKKVASWLRIEEIDKVTLGLDFVSYEDVPNYMSVFNVGTIPFDVLNPTAYYSAPNKMWEYMSQMTPVISTPIPEALDNSDCTFLALNPQDYANAFLAIHRKNLQVSIKNSIGFKKAHSKTWTNSAVYFANQISEIIQKH
jgi:glycosyltransferase involved in cell wall biosynthesis